ncbi:MAG: hypothetical protein RJA70_4748 [Pseudomonadota bacterium]
MESVQRDSEATFRQARVRVGNDVWETEILDLGPPCLLRVQGKVFEVRLATESEGTTTTTGRFQATLRHEQQLAATAALRPAPGGERTVKSPMPGRVLRILCKEGAPIAQGEPLIVVEAMKMENELFAPASGVVSKLWVELGQTLEAGAPLLTIQS